MLVFTDFPIVIPIVIQNAVQRLKIHSINYFGGDSGLHESLTSLFQRSACIVGCCANQGTLFTSQVNFSLSWGSPLKLFCLLIYGGKKRGQKIAPRKYSNVHIFLTIYVTNFLQNIKQSFFSSFHLMISKIILSWSLIQPPYFQTPSNRINFNPSLSPSKLDHLPW